MEPNTVLCVGYARLPEGTTFEVLYKVFGVGLEVDPQNGNIVRAQTTTATMLGDDFLTGMFAHKNIETDINDILEQIARRYRGNGVKAILAAVKKAHNEYLNYKNEVDQGLTCICRLKA